jgi:hypothetical protein
MSAYIVLKDTIDQASLKILLEQGDLWSRCGSLKDELNIQFKRDKDKLEDAKKEEIKARGTTIEKDVKMLEGSLSMWVAKQAVILYP